MPTTTQNGKNALIRINHNSDLIFWSLHVHCVSRSLGSSNLDHNRRNDLPYDIFTSDDGGEAVSSLVASNGGATGMLAGNEYSVQDGLSGENLDDLEPLFASSSVENTQAQDSSSCEQSLGKRGVFSEDETTLS